MRYIDIVTSNNITQNVLAMDLIFESTSDSNIKLTGDNLNNLAGMTKLSEAISFLDTLSTQSTDPTQVSGSLTLVDENGLEFNNVSKIVFDEVIMTGIAGEAIVSLDGNLDRVIDNINNNRAVYEGLPSTTHIFQHNLDTEFLKVDVWVLETAGWQNSIAPITIIDNNSIKVQTSLEKSVRIILEDISSVAKTYGL